MGRIKMFRHFFSFLLVGFALADLIWYGVTRTAFRESNFLFYGSIVAASLATVFYILGSPGAKTRRA